MDIKLSYVPPVKKSFFIFLVIAYLLNLLLLFTLFANNGFIVIVVFSLFYAFFMIYEFVTLTRKYNIGLDMDKKAVEVTKPFKKFLLNTQEITKVEVSLEKKAYVLTITTQNLEHSYILSGSLSFEEPLLIPFLEKITELNENIVLGEYAHGLLHGGNKFNPWSTKMYTTYWIYITSMVLYYIMLLLVINILK